MECTLFFSLATIVSQTDVSSGAPKLITVGGQQVLLRHSPVSGSKPVSFAAGKPVVARIVQQVSTPAPSANPSTGIISTAAAQQVISMYNYFTT